MMQAYSEFLDGPVKDPDEATLPEGATCEHIA